MVNGGVFDLAPTPARQPPSSSQRARILTRLLGSGARPDDAEALGLGNLVELECEVADVLAGMSRYGVGVDAILARGLLEQWISQVEGIDAHFPGVNLNSVDQVRDLLGWHGVIVKKTDRDTLEQHAGHPVVDDVLARRESASLAKFARQLVDAIGPDGRVHPTYDGLGAETGRITASNPPLQQIPARSEEGKQIRRAFVARDERVLIVADYSQVELRILAALSGEPALIEAFKAGDDIHQRIADECGVDRRTAKAINYGLIYGQTAHGLAHTLGCKRGQAKGYIDEYFNALPRVCAYLNEIKRRARHHGASWSRYGRCRRLSDCREKGKRQARALRQAVNHVVQGTAADIYKQALVSVHRALPDDASLVLTVHDEIVVEAPQQRAAEVTEIVRREMESVGDLTVPLKVKTGIGATLAETK